VHGMYELFRNHFGAQPNLDYASASSIMAGPVAMDQLCFDAGHIVRYIAAQLRIRSSCARRLAQSAALSNLLRLARDDGLAGDQDA
jgi:hypothetical protein